MLNNKKIAFLGVGVMGEIIIRSILEHQMVQPEQIIASHRRRDRLEQLHTLYEIHIEESNKVVVQEADMIVLCVKPQAVSSVLKEINGSLKQDAILISIVAGVSLSTLKKEVGHPFIVRCMPNLPVQIQQGMTVWKATEDIGCSQSADVQTFLRMLGKELQVEDEKLLDIATAISGTGPVYVFLFMEALMDAAVRIGFSRDAARQLVIQTVKGAGMLVENSNLHPVELRNMVTSPGGTSAAGLYELEKGGLRTILSDAVWAAYEQSEKLGRQVHQGEDKDKAQ